jgi:hypothetical protein
MQAQRVVESDDDEEERHVPSNGPPNSTWVHEALEVPEGLWVPNRWLPLYREVENSETWLHSKYTKAFDALRDVTSRRDAALKEANDASDALRAAEKAKKKADDAFNRLEAEKDVQQYRKNTAHDHWYNYLVAARDWTDSLTQPGARATKETERIEVEVDDEEIVERRVPTPWEEEREDLFGDNDTSDDEGPSSSQRPPPPPAKRSRRLVPEDDGGSSDDDDDVVMVGQRSWKQRDNEARRNAVDLTSPRATRSCVEEAFRKFGL